MIGNTIDNVERFLDVHIMVGFYQVIENCTSAGISHLALAQPNRVMFTYSINGVIQTQLITLPSEFECLLMIVS